MAKKKRDQPLLVAIEGEQLVIRVGIDTLAFAAEHCPRLYDDLKHPQGPPYCKIIDKDELARDVLSMLDREQEDGTTPVHVLLDDAIVAAQEDGSLAFEDEDDKELTQ